MSTNQDVFPGFCAVHGNLKFYKAIGSLKIFKSCSFAQTVQLSASASCGSSPAWILGLRRRHRNPVTGDQMMEQQRRMLRRQHQRALGGLSVSSWRQACLLDLFLNITAVFLPKQQKHCCINLKYEKKYKHRRF